MTQWITFTLCWVTGMCAGMNANLFSLLLLPVMSTLVETTDRIDLSQQGSFILSSFLIGWAMGGIFIGSASDRIGRVKAMALAVFLFSLFSAIASLSENAIQFAACRFLMGLGVGGAMINMSLLLAENWPEKTRAIAVGSLLTSYQMGVFVSGILVYYVQEWRVVFTLGALPILMIPMLLILLKESSNPLTKDVAPKGNRRSLVTGSLLFGSLLIAYWASASWIPTWIQGLSGAGTGQEKSTATMWHGIAAVLGCLIAGPLILYFGRIRMIAFSFSLAFLISIGMTTLHEEFSYLIYGSYAALGVAIGMAQATLYIYLPELFPANSRGRNVGICLNAGRIITAFVVVFASLLVPFLGGYANGITFFAMAYLIGILTTFVR